MIILMKKGKTYSSQDASLSLKVLCFYWRLNATRRATSCASEMGGTRECVGRPPKANYFHFHMKCNKNISVKVFFVSAIKFSRLSSFIFSTLKARARKVSCLVEKEKGRGKNDKLSSLAAMRMKSQAQSIGHDEEWNYLSSEGKLPAAHTHTIDESLVICMKNGKLIEVFKLEKAQ